MPRGRKDRERLTSDVIELARQYGRYGYRKIAALLRQAGWSVSDGRIERIWKREGLRSLPSSPARISADRIPHRPLQVILPIQSGRNVL